MKCSRRRRQRGQHVAEEPLTSASLRTVTAPGGWFGDDRRRLARGVELGRARPDSRPPRGRPCRRGIREQDDQGLPGPYRRRHPLRSAAHDRAGCQHRDQRRRMVAVAFIQARRGSPASFRGRPRSPPAFRAGSSRARAWRFVPRRRPPRRGRP